MNEDYGSLNTEDVEFVDQLVDDYLMFRGFVTTRKTFIKEKDEDRNKNFQASKIVTQLYAHVHNYELEGLLELWNHLATTFFSRLDEDMSWTVSKLELSLKRYYVIFAIQTGHRDKCLQFFEVLGPELTNNRHWRSWFALPFAKQPASDSTFKVYFSRNWADTLSLSLNNFLCAIFNGMELPKILNFNAERKVRINLQRDLDHLKAENQKLREKVDNLRQQLEIQKNTRSINPSPISKLTDQSPDNSSPVPQRGPSAKGTDSIAPNRKLKSETDGKSLIVKKQDMFTENSAVNCVRFSPNGSAIAAGTEGGVVRIWSLDTVNSSENAIYGNSSITSLDWVRPWSGEMLLSGSAEGKVKLWNVATQESIGEVTMHQSYKRIINVRCGPGQHMFAVCSAGENLKNGGALTMWNLSNLQSLHRLKFDPPTVINSLAFNHNGSLLAAAGQDGFVRLFDLQTLRQISKWKAHRNGVAGVQFNYDETCIYSVGGKEKIKTWSTHVHGQVLKTYSYAGVHKNISYADISLDHDAKYFVLSSRENNGVLYHVDQMRPLQNLGSHSKPVVSVDWNPLQNSIVTASLDNTVYMTHFNYPDK